jgi:PAS domain S-box-containing protein
MNSPLTKDLQDLLQFLHVCPVGLVSFDDNGVIERINPHAASLLAPVLVGSHADNLVDALRSRWPELGSLVQRAGKRIGRVATDHRLICGNDASTPRWLSLTLERVSFNHNALAITDVTAAVGRETLLRESAGRLRRVFDSIDQGYCICEMICDDSGKPIDYRFLEANPLFEEFTGLADPVGNTALQLVPDLEPIWVETYARVALAGETLRFEQGFGAVGRWFDVFSVPVEPHGRFAIVLKDQTDRHAAELALRESEERFRTIANRLPILTWQQEVNGRLSWVNEDFCAFFETNQLAACADSYLLQNRLNATDAQRIADRYRAATTMGVQLDEEVRVQRGDGAIRWMEVHLQPQTGVDGTTTRLVGTASDITERRHAAEELRSEAAVAAFRAHLTDALAEASTAREAQEIAALQLADRLPGTSVHFADIDETGEFGRQLLSELRAGSTVIVGDVAHDSRLLDPEQHATLTRGVAAHIMVPIVREDRTVAGLFVHHGVPHDWTDEEVAVTQETAIRGWAAVDRARHNIALQLGQVRAQLLSELIADLETKPTVNAQLETLVRSLVPRIADYATVEALGSDAELSLPEMPARLSSRSHMAVPLDLGNGVNAALVVGLSDPDRDHFTDDDLDFLREVGLRTGIVLAASRIREQEHDISVRLQQALLPDSIVWHPNFLVEARYQAASSLMEVGGDWYDTFSWPNGSIGVMVGDVVGHNIESAAIMGRLRWATAASAAYVDPTPASLLGALDRAALDRAALDPSDSTFATAVCAIIDPQVGQLTYSSAGHPPIVVVAPNGRAELLTDATGLPVCPLATGARPESTTILEPGSLVVLYSDGLVERRKRSIDAGIERLVELASKYVSMPLALIADRLIADLSGDISSDDDIVIACCRYSPAVAEFRRTIPSRASALAELRSDLIPWLTERHIATTDPLLAMSEACANAIGHAYLNQDTGPVHVALTDHGPHVTIRVIDHGKWRSPSRQNPHRGRGTSIMQKVAIRFKRESDESGTTVTIIVPTHRTMFGD